MLKKREDVFLLATLELHLHGAILEPKDTNKRNIVVTYSSTIGFNDIFKLKIIYGNKCK